MIPSSPIARVLFLLPVLALARFAAAVPATAFGIVDDMAPGWNLGNTLDASGGETGWGNPVTTQRMIDTVHAAGFRTMRIPIRWDEHLSGTAHTIATTWLDRIEQIVNYGLKDSMYVIINVHHNNGWEDPTTANATNAQDYLTKIWAQVAARFQKYDNHLIFETMNEPTVTTNGSTDWYGKVEYYNVVNQLNAAALSTIRATGGNNAGRLVMMPGYAANSDSRMSYMVVPKDSMVAVSVHDYDPMDFCLTVPGVSTFTETTLVDNTMNLVANTFVKKGIPVVLGEWGTVDKNDLAERAKHAAYFTKVAKAARITTLLWDDGGSMGILKRSVPTWAFPSIIQGIMSVAGRTTSVQSSSSPAVAPSVGLRVFRVADGIRFESTTSYDRYTLTGMDGGFVVLPGGRTGSIPAGSVRSGAYVLRADGVDGAMVQKILIGP